MALIRKPVLLPLFLLMSSGVFAENASYLGIGLSAMDFGNNISDPDAYKIQLGHQYTNNFGVELAYLGPRNTQRTSAGQTVINNATYNNYIDHKINGAEIFGTYTLGDQLFARAKLGYANVNHNYHWSSSYPDIGRVSITSIRIINGEEVTLGDKTTFASSAIRGIAAGLSLGYNFSLLTTELSVTTYGNDIDASSLSFSTIYRF